MGTLWNTYAFYVLYANIDKFDASQYQIEESSLSMMDRWLFSRLNTLVKSVDENLSAYKVTETAKVLQEFVDELSNWYVRRSRERFWGKELTQDKINAYMTLYTALVTTIKAAAPMIPFMTEDIYQNLVRSVDKTAPESIHLCDFPQVDTKYIDCELEADMELVLEIVSLGRAARNTANIKNRQPIGNMYVKAERQLNEFYREIIEDELNIKSVAFKDDMEAYLTYSFKPQFKVLGPKAGKQIGEIKATLGRLNGQAAKEELDKTGGIKLEISTGEFTLTAEDVEVSMAQTEGYAAERYNNVTVAIETTLSEALIEEGFVREIISKIQTMRKENKFEVMDRITVFVSGNQKLADLALANAALIKEVVLADDIRTTEIDGMVKEWNINGEKVELGIK